MQNLNNKKQNYTSHIAPHTSQKGITLIALIITIIVMLILVGVTINIALNGGLFTKADDAKKLTQLAIDKEELQIEIVTAYDEENKVVDLGTLKTNLENKGWKDITISGDKLTCTSPKGNTFTVDRTGKITDPSDDDDDVDNSSDLEKYLFNEDGTGKTGLLTMDENTDVITFVDDSNTITDASTSILYMNSGSENGESYVVIEYKGADYKVNVTSFNFATAAATVGSDNEKVTKLETIYNGNDEEIKIKQYFLGYSGTGKYLMNLLDMKLSEENETYIFKVDNIISDASSSIVLSSFGEGSFTIKYKDTSTYIITFDNNMNAKEVTKVVEYENYIAYTVEGENLAENGGIVEISTVECKMIAGSYIMTGEIIYCSDINELMPDGYEFDNTGIEYTKVAWDNKHNQLMAVYSSKDNGWINPSIYNGDTIRYYIKEGTPVLNSKITITTEQLNEITKDLTEI